MRRSLPLVAVLALLVAAPAHAHFVWLEVEPSVQPGRAQPVALYFGEPHEGLREETGGRLDQQAGVRLHASDPAQQLTPVKLEKKPNHLAGRFTPRSVGRHQLTAVNLLHPVMDLTAHGQGLTKPMFYARTQALAFEPGRVSEREPELTELLELDLVPLSRTLDLARGTIAARPGGELVVRAVFKGKPLAKRRVIALGPNGWMKELPTTDSWGVTSFTPLWPGLYVLTISHDEAARGEFQGKAFEVISHRATFSFVVADPESHAPARREP